MDKNSETVKIKVLGKEKKEFNFTFNYSIMKKICHQRPERSFFIKGKKLPLCSRCLGIYVSFLIGVFFILFLKSYFLEITWMRLLVIFLIGFIPISIDGFTQLFGWRKSNNILRFITGIIFGFSMSWILIYLIRKLIEIFI